MHTIETTAVVTPEHTVTVTLPLEIEPGEYDLILVVRTPPPKAESLSFADWPPHVNTLVDPTCTFRREDLYGDDDR